MGTWRHEQPAWGLVNFLRTQEVQDPLFLDTDWLRAGHVDEFLQFLPAPKFKKSGKKKHSSSTNPRPWILAVADPHLALSLLHSAQVSGHGHQKLSSRPRQTFPGAPLAAIPQDTINQFLSNPYNTHINTYCATRIARNLHRLKRETGLTDDEIIRLPVLFENDQEFFFINYNVTKFFGGDVLAPIGPSVFSRDIVMAGSYLPNAINGVLLSEEKVVVPKQWGPLVGGKDIFEEEVRRVYGGVGIDVGFVDDWTTHHGGGGDVHCGTNTWREAGRWWE